MADNPILILQMQRLGDLVLTFPLLGWLQRLHPNNPLWIVGEEYFFKHLMTLSPNATFFPYTAAAALKKRRFHAVINLSHREEAIALAGEARGNLLLGPYRTASGKVHVNGNWQLYRMSLVHNNRHNQYHWSDLHGLDLVPPQHMAQTRWPPPRTVATTASAHIGLFLGASEEDKKPDAAFWTELARRLLLAGHRPVLLGGEMEKPVGGQVAASLRAHSLDLTGRFSLSELAAFIHSLDLFVTPDTGPMHVAVWSGTPTLNLSLGPVNAWETGPFSPGHLVLRAKIGCIGCWRCVQRSVLCKDHLSPSRTASLIHTLMTRGRDALSGYALPGQELLLSRRDSCGLYDLEALLPRHPGRHAAGKFWHDFFGNLFGIVPDDAVSGAWRNLGTISPKIQEKFIRSLARLNKNLAHCLKTDSPGDLESPQFWLSFPPLLRPLTSYMQLMLHNERFRRPAFADALAMAEKLACL